LPERLATRDHEARHGRIDFTREFDKARFLSELLRLPCEIKRVNRDAMPAQSRPRIKRHEAERFRLRGGDDLPDVNVHRAINRLEFVDERDVDAAENVFEQLRRLGRAAVRDGNESADRRANKFPLRRFQTRGRVTADDFGNFRNLAAGIAGVFALRRITRGENLSRLSARTIFQDFAQFIFRRAGICRGFEHDQLSALQMRRDGFAGFENERQIRFAISFSGVGTQIKTAETPLILEKSLEAENLPAATSFFISPAGICLM
jgi:hypothetical protein